MNNLMAREEIITPIIAEYYLRLNESNRPLNERIVREYADAMRKGQWRSNGEGISFSKDGRLINGQHRLSAIIKCGLPIKMLVIRGCDNDSFMTCDRGKTRTFRDIFSIAKIPNYSRVSAIVNRYLKLHFGQVFVVSSGAHSCDGNMRTMKISAEDSLNEYNSSNDLYDEAACFCMKCRDRLRLFSISDIGGYYVYLVKDKHHDKAVVEKFFAALFNQRDYSIPAATLLRDTILKDGVGNRSLTGKSKSMFFVKAWNAYVSGKTIKILRWNEKTEGAIKLL